MLVQSQPHDHHHQTKCLTMKCGHETRISILQRSIQPSLAVVLQCSHASPPEPSKHFPAKRDLLWLATDSYFEQLLCCVKPTQCCPGPTSGTHVPASLNTPCPAALVPHLQLDREQLHVSILPQELGHACQVLVGMADHVHDRQQLAQGHGELLGHPTLGADFAALLARAAGAGATASVGNARGDLQVIHLRQRFLHTMLAVQQYSAAAAANSLQPILCMQLPLLLACV